MAKKFYWLKLNENFFDDDTMRFIEEQEKGIYYSNFYLKLCLKSIKDEGKLIRLVGEMLIPYDVKALSKLTGVDYDIVKSAMELFSKIGLVKVLDSGEIYLTQIGEMIGSETDKAQIMRRKRAEKKIGNNVTDLLPKCYTEIDIDIEKDKEKDTDKNKRETYVSILGDYTSNQNLYDAILGFIEMRKKQKGFTTRAFKLALNKLDTLANDDATKIEIVNQSVMNGWKSFYQLKNNGYQNKELPTWYAQTTDDSVHDVDDDELKRMQEALRKKVNG